MRIVDSSPHPSMLIESLRDFGYTLETALADVIDNSIAAESNRINILANFAEGEEFVAIIDDGKGMSEKELLAAMRLGSKNPLDQREATDLGRFGLGLKTASFSQCRKLTVVSRQANRTIGATWDLDYVARENRWDVIVVDDYASIPGYELLQNSGTIVVWQNLDRLTEKSDRRSNEEYFEERMSDAIDHLALVYHRFLKTEGTNKAISISVNNRSVNPIDPFLSDHPATQTLESETIVYNNHKVSMKPYTLPSYNKMSSQQWNALGGKDGHTKNQGFYVYRERRLIVWGTWFQLAPKSELNKLSRVKVDIGNDTDSDWKIDVLKSQAYPPLAVRNHMRAMIRNLTQPSRNVHNGTRRRTLHTPMASGWVTEHEGTRFRPNMEHPLIVDHITSLTVDQADQFRSVVTMLASSLPMDQIHARMSSKPHEVTQAEIDPEDLLKQLTMVYEALSTAGMNNDNIRNILRYEEPFRSNWDQVKKMISRLESEVAGA